METLVRPQDHLRHPMTTGEVHGPGLPAMAAQHAPVELRPDRHPATQWVGDPLLASSLVVAQRLQARYRMAQVHSPEAPEGGGGLHLADGRAKREPTADAPRTEEHRPGPALARTGCHALAGQRARLRCLALHHRPAATDRSEELPSE